MENKYAAVLIQTRVKECFSKQDTVDNFRRACKIIQTSAHMHPFGSRIPTQLFAFDAHAHNHGYSRKEMAEKIAIEIPGKEMQDVVDTAKGCGVYIVTSALEYDPAFKETFFTCFFMVDPKGEVVYKYRKINVHMGTEKTLSPYDVMDKYYEVYGKGKTRLETFFPVADTPIGKIGAMIAHDRMFPEAARAMAMNGAEILILGSQPEPTVASGRWEAINKVRAFENMLYVLAPNYGEFVSDERAKQRWAGHSMVVDYDGQIIASVPYPGEATCSGLLDMEALRERRADPYDSPLAELKTDIYREIYAEEVYGKNRYAASGPPDTAAERLQAFPQIYEKLVARKVYTKPKPQQR